MKRIAVTGGAGQIAYSLLFRIASGELMGREQPIALHILEIPEALGALEGVVMELQDCAYPLLQEIKIGSEAKEVFDGVNLALLVGSKPRGPGMERKELLEENGKIFVGQGKALERAAHDVKVFVVGNPCNTNCLIAMKNAKELPEERFFAMTRLDQNRAQFQLANKAGVALTEVSGVPVWGNHSATQVPDFTNTTIGGRGAEEVIGDRGWLEGDFFTTVQKRGAAIIGARGKSSAASAANAAIDGVRSLYFNEGDIFSMARYSKGNPYGIDDDLIFSFPCQLDSEGECAIVEGMKWDRFIEARVRASEKELLEEKALVAHLL